MPHLRGRLALALPALVALALAACGADAATVATSAVPVATGTGPTVPTEGSSADAIGALSSRIDDLDRAVAAWAASGTIAEADAAAETAYNLVVGPGGPGYGDIDGDGTVSGATTAGLLPSLDGADPGLALLAVGGGAPECVTADVLGGEWDDPATRWEEMGAAIDAWTPAGNTMPSLPSHPQRIVGWATFTIDTDDLGEAHEYAGHAALHVGVSRNALTC